MNRRILAICFVCDVNNINIKMAGTGVNWTVMPGNQRVLAMSLVIFTKRKYVKFVSKRYKCLKLQGLGKIHNILKKQDV